MSPTESIAALAGPLDAVLFDMDGVVTDTAQAHAAAWKRLFDELLTARASDLGEVFRPFDTGRDYRQFVDGKARDDGVRSFLASRSITLPEGADGDASDAQTVRALGARKNGFFNDWLKHNPVQPYPGTLALIHALREASIKTAVFSASRNAEVVLRSAGVLELFDAKVDGEDAARLGLPGKPDPALMQEAAARLGVVAARCAVVEDALAGVQAGAAGGFGLVVGVDRCSQGEMLRRAGATAVVNDLAELVLLQGHGLGLKTLANLPSVWQHEGELRQRMAGKQPAVFLDYDGTLTPIVEDHSKALITDDMREAVRRLSRICTVAIVSGRDLAMLTSLVKLDSVWYAGSHGFEIAGPQGSTKGMERGVEFLPELARAEQMLRERLAGVAGHSVERKRFSVAVHFRQVADKDQSALEKVVEGVLAECRRLHIGHGKKVFELQPAIDWNKGHAVLWLLQQLGLDRPDTVPVYVGDDITDENAFRALSGLGLGIAVRDRGTRQTAADLALTDVNEVRRLLDMLGEIGNAVRGQDSAPT